MKKPRILFWDIETSPLKAYIWGLGKQVVRHNQLTNDASRWGVICVTYCWNDGSPAQAIDWGYHKQDTKHVIEEFDKIAAKADMTIGKNSDRFDVKMINAARMLHGLPGRPTWSQSSDDLEKQMRKHFRLPSQSLDYISGQLGLGGKIKMDMQDWIDILEKTNRGQEALEKMVRYGKKDVEDTRALWYKLSEHFIPKWNQANYSGLKCCRHEDCGSTNIHKNGTSFTATGKRQEYWCNDCKRYAGSTMIHKNGGEGNIR